MRISVSAYVSMCLVRVAVSQIVITASQSERTTGGAKRVTLEWLWRTTSRFETLDVTWDRSLYGFKRLYYTSWARFLFERVVYPRIKDVDDAELRLIRTNPDEKGMEELRVQFLGTINHASTGTMRCAVTTEDGRSAQKSLSVVLWMRCTTHEIVQDGGSRRTCAPDRPGWLSAGFFVNSTLISDNVPGETVLTIRHPGFGYVEHAPECLLSCYLGPDGPIVSVLAKQSCRVRTYKMEVRIGSWRVFGDTFELPR